MPEHTSLQCNWKGNQKGKGAKHDYAYKMKSDWKVAIFM